MSIEYIRKTYGLPVKVGMQVSIRKGAGSMMDGLTGKVLRARGPYVVVRGPSWVGNFHPGDIEIPAAIRNTKESATRLSGGGRKG